MGCNTLGDYHDLYLYQDILLLADIFEQSCMPQELSARSCSLLYGTRIGQVKLETLHDIEMHQFLEQGMRGGISMITHRYAKANNKYLQDYDPEKPTSFIIYKDANNLYGRAMSQPLPIRDFEWMPERQIASFDVTTVTDDADTGYILEVDLEYPPELHDLHSDYPLAPEKIEISPEMLARYQLNLKDELEYTPAKVAKLVPNLWNKRKYVIH